MPIMQIYQAGQKIQAIEFHRHLFIYEVDNADVLRWETSEKRPKGMGGFPQSASRIHIWLIGATSYYYYLSFVDPDWQLVVDHVLLDRAEYKDFLVSDKRVELLYKPYKFVCSFPPASLAGMKQWDLKQKKENPITYPHDRIQDITPQGVHYVDDYGATQFIDFELCRRNWVDYINVSVEYTTNTLSVNDTRGVGWRDICGKPPYIEFFSDPKIRFEFTASLSCKHPTRVFAGVHRKVAEMGWQTGDLS